MACFRNDPKIKSQPKISFSCITDFLILPSWPNTQNVLTHEPDVLLKYYILKAVALKIK